jgi:hypothetical protein
VKKLIDERGRIFGFVNIIDLFIIFTVLFVGGYLAIRFINPSVDVIVNQDDVILTFFCEMTPDYAVDNLEKGGIVEDDTKNIYFGRVTDFTVYRGIIHTQDAMGNQVIADAEGYSCVEIKASAKGQIIKDGGVRISGNVYTIGHTMTIRAGRSKFYLKISNFEAVQKG